MANGDSFASGGGGAGSILANVPVIGGLLQGIFNLFGGGGDPLAQFAGWTTSAFQAVGNWIHNLGNWALHALTSIASFLRNHIEGFLKGVFTRLYRLIDHLHQFLESHLRPIVNFIKRIRNWYDRMYQLYWKPTLNMLQHIRSVLRIMRALHIKFAIALDNRIARFEGYAGGLFNQVRGILNGFIDIFNSVIDPLSIIRKPTIVLSIRRTMHAMIRVSTGLPPGYFFPSPRKNARAGLGFLPANFNPSDPSMNPPASAFLDGNDGLGLFSGFAPGTIPDNSAVDDLDSLDFFNDDLWGEPTCTDPAQCLLQMLNRNADAVTSS